SEIKARVQYLYDDATVRRASVAPDLVGLQLAQVPRNSASAGIVWNHGRWSIAPQARFVGEQFEDDTNTLRLAAATLVDVSLRLTLGAGIDIYLSAENLADHRLETGRSSDGVVNLGTPRLILLGLRLNR
ncbi:MAG: TonB-dependent receptor, partial [Opitutus sp.]